MKQVAISSWGIAVTLVVFWFFSGTSNEVTGSVADGAVAFEDHRTDTLSVSIFDSGRIIGHFATRVRYQLPEDAEIRLPNLVHHEINDGLIEVLNDLDIKQVRRMKSNDINAIEDRLSLVLSKRRTPLPITQVKLESARILLKQ